MPYIFSQKQIDHCHHLLIDHNYDVNQIADVMDTSIRNAHHLIRLVKQKYQDKYVPLGRTKPFKVKPVDVFPHKHEPVAFTRPKAEYSNKRHYDLV